MASPNLIYRSGARTVIPTLIQAGSKLEKPKVNKLFLPIKAVYFWLWAGSASILPFIPVYMGYVGLSAVQTGLILGLEPFVMCLSTPLWGSLADKLSKHKLIMVCAIIGNALVYGSISLVPLLNRSVHWTNVTVTDAAKEDVKGTISYGEFIFNGSTTECECLSEFLDITCKNSKCEKNLHWNFLTALDDVPHKSSSLNNICSHQTLCNNFLKCVVEDNVFTSESFLNVSTDSLLKCMTDFSDVPRTSLMTIGSNPYDASSRKMGDSLSSHPFSRNSSTAFVTMMVLIFTARFIKSPVVPILDATTQVLVKQLNDAGIAADYGRQRLWGAISWGTFSPFTGFIIDTYSAHVVSFNDYLPAFCMYLLVMLLALCNVAFIKIARHEPPPGSLTLNLGRVLGKPSVLVFLFATGITGVAVGVINAYLFLFLAELSSSHTLMGLTLTLTCVSEVPFMFFATKLIDKFGHRGVISLTLFCYALRLTCYSLLQNPWEVLPVELLHGVTFGAFWPACTSYCNLLAPEGMTTTVQSVTVAVRNGLGYGIGAMVGGVIYHTYGPRLLFRGAAILCLGTVIFYWPASFFLDRRDTMRSQRSEYEEI